MLNVAVHSADIQDGDGAPRVLDARTRRFFPFIEHIFADGGYQGSQLARRLARTGSWLIEIVSDRTFRASRSCPSAGSSSARSPGSAGAAASPATSSVTSAKLPPSYASR